ncbi:Radical SAM superfamily protein [Desulfacinum hydrothermale DSM 13146]|uniref:Radical SAM superfamily protein n=1 Tax=Desulfacinum hydrothermale DSM 13146 TaxID=1121390 RepID=A0A1W1X188_9BACT|nr:radical SAM protein [Desulfacinum hydrothermale]SMC17712.1 Radical SAM superfamily protein [Desulfacinum hydrothermale DSM 13146]
MTNPRPALLYANENGDILDHPYLEMVGSQAGRWKRPAPADLIPLPEGSELFRLPGRYPVGYDRRKRRFQVLTRDPYAPSKTVEAMAAFVSPAHTQIYTAAYKAQPNAPLLPLFAYTAVGWHAGRFFTTAVRVDPDPRQDFSNFDPEKIAQNARRRMRQESDNRLIQHLGKCALTYGCAAARNLFMNRWEAPLPTSPVCNARCLGCISLQEREDLCATQDRITFVPSPAEIAGVAVPHLMHAPRAVVSFGQGCEGEPLLQGPTLEEAVRIMRRETSRGTINCNTNGSLPEVIRRLAQAGCDSIRVSLNSARPEYYHAYYRPKGYSFDDVIRSIQAMKAAGGFVSINYFVLPGFTDDPQEVKALCRLVETTGLDFIQMRNFNADPQWILAAIGYKPSGKPQGIRKLMQLLRERFPHLQFGYFNPCLDPQA